MLRAKVLKQIAELDKLKKAIDAESKHIDSVRAEEFKKIGLKIQGAAGPTALAPPTNPPLPTGSMGLDTTTPFDKICPNDSDFIDSDQIKELERRHRIHANYLDHRLRSLRLMLDLLSTEENPECERIGIGTGVAGTAVAAEIPATLRHHKTAYNFPAILFLNDPDNVQQWQKDGQVLAGQPPIAQSTHTLTSRPDDYAKEQEKKRNPYEYVVAETLAASLVESQNHLNMHVLNAKALKIEKIEDRKSGQDPWEHPKSPLRIKISIDGKTRYLYTKAIDICTGPGPTRKLNDVQIDPVLAKKLMAKNKLIYGQDGDPTLKGDVVFYGGGARNASIILDVISGAKPKARVKYWVARKGQNFDNNKKLNRMFNDLDDSKESKMALGSLKRVTELPNGKLQLTFAEPVNKGSKPLIELTNKTIQCDQLVIGIGQVANTITKDLPCFEPYIYPGKPDVGIQDVPIGTRSQDHRIIAWGAAAATGLGLTKADWDKVRPLITADAKNLPYESSGTATILRSCANIRLLARMTKNQGVFPTDPTHERKIEKLVPADINIATLVQLTEFIKAADDTINLETAANLAKQIVAIRSKKPTGITNVKEIESVLPQKVYAAIKLHYFPYRKALTPELFEPLPAIELIADTGRKSEKTKQQGLKLFDQAALSSVETEDSFAFVSEAGEDSTKPDETERTDQVVPAAMPMILVQSS